MGDCQYVEVGDYRINVDAFRQALIAWGKEHFRAFPWRLTDDPYRILVAEVMLHRTQAAQVVPVYERFVERYLRVAALASAPREDLHQTLHSLGLRWRIDLIHEMASVLVGRFGEQIPRGKTDLQSLPGVSAYIAGAVRCFSWNLPEPLMDTNTVRVVGRLFALKTRDSSRRSPCFRELISVTVDRGEPRAYNYALLDLADQVCMRKRAPLCSGCPVQQHCANGVSDPQRSAQLPTSRGVSDG